MKPMCAQESGFRRKARIMSAIPSNVRDAQRMAGRGLDVGTIAVRLGIPVSKVNEILSGKKN